MKTTLAWNVFTSESTINWMDCDDSDFDDSKYYNSLVYSDEKTYPSDSPSFLDLIKSRSPQSNWDCPEYQSILKQCTEFVKHGSMTNDSEIMLGNSVKIHRRNFADLQSITLLIDQFRGRRENEFKLMFFGTEGTHRVSNAPIRGNATYQRGVAKKARIVKACRLFSRLPLGEETDIVLGKTEFIKKSRELDKSTSNSLFMSVTLKPPYRGIMSWFSFCKWWDTYRAFLYKRYGKFTYAWVKECHSDGSVHLHCIMIFHEYDFKVFWYDKTKRWLVDKKDEIASGWKYGNIDMRSVSNFSADVDYLVKYLIKNFATEYNENANPEELRAIRKAELGMALCSLTRSRQHYFPTKKKIGDMMEKFTEARLDTVNKQIEPEQESETFRMVGVSSSKHLIVGKTYTSFLPDCEVHCYRKDAGKEYVEPIRRFTHGELSPVVKNGTTARAVPLELPKKSSLPKGGQNRNYEEWRDSIRHDHIEYEKLLQALRDEGRLKENE